MAKSKNKIFIVWDTNNDIYFYVDEFGITTEIEAIKFYIKEQNITIKQGLTLQIYQVAKWKEYHISPPTEIKFTLIDEG
jgi:hypothetical protein